MPGHDIALGFAALGSGSSSHGALRGRCEPKFVSPKQVSDLNLLSCFLHMRLELLLSSVMHVTLLRLL